MAQPLSTLVYHVQCGLLYKLSTQSNKNLRSFKSQAKDFANTQVVGEPQLPKPNHEKYVQKHSTMPTGVVKRIYHSREILEGLVDPGIRRDAPDAASRNQVEDRKFEMEAENRNSNQPMKKKKWGKLP